MSLEDNVTYGMARHLAQNGWAIVHYHAPGGQASLPIHLSSGETIYLDLIAYKLGAVVAAENKGYYSEADLSKLQILARDPAAVEQVKEAVLRHCRMAGLTVVQPLTLYPVHGFARGVARRCSSATLMQLQADGSIRAIGGTRVPHV